MLACDLEGGFSQSLLAGFEPTSVEPIVFKLTGAGLTLLGSTGDFILSQSRDALRRTLSRLKRVMVVA